MKSWGEFERADPALAQFGASRLHGQVAYLGTVGGRGRPRVHPVTPIIGHGRLLLFMESTSPKGADLRRGSGYALHASVTDTSGSNGEFLVSGFGTLIRDREVRALAVQDASYTPLERYVLFELSVERVLMTRYIDDGAEHTWWQSSHDEAG
jgi:hypothetical protein